MQPHVRRFALACLLLTPSLTSSQVTIDELDLRLEELTHELEAQRRATHVAGLALAIVHGDDVIYAKGLGMADVEAQKPATPQTLFAIGSTTKAFTSTLLAMLADEERCNWDDPVTRYVPEFRLAVNAVEEDAEVTLRDLLSHRTGFTRMSLLWASGEASREEILRFASAAKPWAPFRESFYYNNVQYLAAGEVAAKVGGASWDELVEQRFFEPLGMSSSTTRHAVAAADPRMATGYAWNDSDESFERETFRNIDNVGPAGSINSNVLDMTRWLRFLIHKGEFEGKRLVSRRRLRHTQTRQIDVAPKQDYGMGWFLGRWKRSRELQHGGNIDGFSAMVAFLPKEQLGLVLLTNASTTPLQETIRALVWGALLDERVEPVEATTAAPPEWEEFFGEYVADYGQFEDETFTVKAEEGRLMVDIPSQMAYALDPLDAEGLYPFQIAPSEIQASFGRDPEGRVRELRLHQGGLVIEHPRRGYSITPDLSPEEFAPYLGRFVHVAFDEPLTVLVRNGRLACDVPGQMPFELHLPNAEDHWVFRATSDLAIEFVSGDDGSVESLVFHERGTETPCARVIESSQPTEVLPTLRELVQLAKLEARQAKLDELGGLRLSGPVRMLHSGIRGEQTTILESDRCYRESVDLGRFGRVVNGHHEGGSWTFVSFDEHDSLEGDDVRLRGLLHPGVWLGDWRRTFDEVEIQRATEYAGRPALVVRLKSSGLNSWYATIDTDSGDVVQVEGFAPAGLGVVVPTRLFFEGYRDVDGFRVPMTYAIESESLGRTELDYARVETGLEFDESRYQFDL